MRKVVAGHQVGSLEDAVLEVLWGAEEPLSGRELLARLPGRRRAYTTVMTVLGRLVDKGLVERIPDGRSFRYQTLGDPEELTAAAIARLLSSAQDPGAVLAHLVDDLEDPGVVEQLAQALRRRRGRKASRRGGEP
ncbi:BlaI/MecI/CopY family transcriptional regulator [Aciditerrimonas ferrireducens]|jgi:predicted transcriptional regulator|uniref:BlaI/MecI/CopY family transcriptional regulator n=1 Tax=Aciditerrimonas ferrireducens TaxID=667306 RepID=UPI0020038D92|nr:BlaI/MecI/CopY family transcriptional regulator [Aciditerrimonas ferrireducens]MCK4178227.1 BlaI/MecI/CopY family transcriptional regulator [Aciditerrimonas ferrireducens]